MILPLRSCIQSEGEDVAPLSPCPTVSAGAVLVLVPEREDAPLPARRVARRVLAGRVAREGLRFNVCEGAAAGVGAVFLKCSNSSFEGRDRF